MLYRQTDKQQESAYDLAMHVAKHQVQFVMVPLLAKPHMHQGFCIINPRRACAARVTVVVMSVYVSVCLSVKSYLTLQASLLPENITYSAGDEGQEICGDLFETVPQPRLSAPSLKWPVHMIGYLSRG